MTSYDQHQYFLMWSTLLKRQQQKEFVTNINNVHSSVQDIIFDHAPPEAKIALREASKSFKNRVPMQNAAHVITLMCVTMFCSILQAFPGSSLAVFFDDFPPITFAEASIMEMYKIIKLQVLGTSIVLFKV